MASRYSYEIEPRPADLGGGWRLRLLEDGEEVGGGVFPSSQEFADPELANKSAYLDAQQEGNDWLASFGIDG